MTRWPWIFVIMASLVAVTAGCFGGSDEPQPAPSPTASAQLEQSAEAGGVTVDATWLTGAGDTKADVSQYAPDRFVLIEVAFTTHSGDVSKIDMTQASELKQGSTVLQPVAWVRESDDSHHRRGVVVFPRELGSGPVTLAVALGDRGNVQMSFQEQS